MSNILDIIVNLLNFLMKRQRLQKRKLSVLLAGVLLLTAVNAHAVTHTGVLGTSMYADIPMNLATESLVSLTYIHSCTDLWGATMELYTEWGSKQHTMRLTYNQGAWGPFPLAAGNWTVRVMCNQSYNPDNPVAYTLEQSIVAGSSQFVKDSEPDYIPDEPVTPIILTTGKSFSGWIGYEGYKELYVDPSNRYGVDPWDAYYFDLKKGTRIKIRLQYDNTLINALGDRDISVESYFCIAHLLYGYPHFDFSNWWQFSGDTTDEFTIPKDGTYLFKVIGGASSGYIPKTNYGGYQITFIVNGDDPTDRVQIGTATVETDFYSPREGQLTVSALVPGHESSLEVSIRDDKQIYDSVKLFFALFVDKDKPLEIIGTTTCSLGVQVTDCHATVFLSKDMTNIVGHLVIRAYDDRNQLLDQSIQMIDIYQEKKMVVAPFLMLLFPDGIDQF